MARNAGRRKLLAAPPQPHNERSSRTVDQVALERELFGLGGACADTPGNRSPTTVGRVISKLGAADTGLDRIEKEIRNFAFF